MAKLSYSEVLDLITKADSEAQEACENAGGDLQGWDNLIQVKKLVNVTGMHPSHAPYRHQWAEPVGWEPEIPSFAEEDWTLDSGSLWGSEQEEAGIVCFDNDCPEEGEEGLVDSEELVWAATGQFKNRGTIDVPESAVTVEIRYEGERLLCDDSVTAEIAEEWIQGCFGDFEE